MMMLMIIIIIILIVVVSNNAAIRHTFFVLTKLILKNLDGFSDRCKRQFERNCQLWACCIT